MNVMPRRSLQAERWPDVNHPMRIWLLPGQLDALVSDPELAEHFIPAAPHDELIAAAQAWAISDHMDPAPNLRLNAAVLAYNAACAVEWWVAPVDTTDTSDRTPPAPQTETHHERPHLHPRPPKDAHMTRRKWLILAVAAVAAYMLVATVAYHESECHR